MGQKQERVHEKPFKELKITQLISQLDCFSAQVLEKTREKKNLSTEIHGNKQLLLMKASREIVSDCQKVEVNVKSYIAIYIPLVEHTENSDLSIHS